MQVLNLISGSALTCAVNIPLRAAARLMTQEEVGSLAVMRDNDLAGIVTERDVLRAVSSGADLDSETVNDWMTPNPDTVSADLEVSEAADWMLATGYRHLPVTGDDGRLVGIASIKDVLWALAHPEANRT
jgi:CBS domain-containing protein